MGPFVSAEPQLRHELGAFGSIEGNIDARQILRQSVGIEVTGHPLLSPPTAPADRGMALWDRPLIGTRIPRRSPDSTCRTGWPSLSLPRTRDSPTNRIGGPSDSDLCLQSPADGPDAVLAGQCRVRIVSGPKAKGLPGPTGECVELLCTLMSRTGPEPCR